LSFTYLIANVLIRIVKANVATNDGVDGKENDREMSNKWRETKSSKWHNKICSKIKFCWLYI